MNLIRFCYRQRLNPCLLASVVILPNLLTLLITPTAAADKPMTVKNSPKFSPANIEFFKTKVRPLFVTRCFKCHGPKTKAIQGGLRLDSREAILKGGETGPAIVPGNPAKSLLIKAVNYSLLEMPPRSKLPAGEIAILTKWVKLGAPWSRGKSGLVASPLGKTFPLAQRKRSHWAWQPLRRPQIPHVKNSRWAETAIDRFILAKLEDQHLSPAEQADRRVLIRRATFDLIGLPPSPQDVADFVNDPTPTRTAFAKVVDRLLKSPHFGERWARHWLDLVRYAESLGHEFDYPLHYAYQYRDYVIRAFNADVPYDRFVTEHIAGDLLKNPRRHPLQKYNESVIGTGFWFLGEDKHAPVDVRGDEAAKIDNRLDVFSKTFLGLTVACARCHDHKFDAISTKDYYALAGFLQSSRQQTALLDPFGRIETAVRQLRELRESGRQRLINALPQPSRTTTDEIERFLLASRKLIVVQVKPADRGEKTNRLFAETARKYRLDLERLRTFVAALQEIKPGDVAHPMWLWATLARSAGKAGSGSFLQQKQAVAKQLADAFTAYENNVKQTQLYTDFNGHGFADWFVTGQAFGKFPTSPHQWDAKAGGATAVVPGIVHSGLLADRLGGVVCSPTFTLTHDHILYRIAGQNAQVRLIIDGYVMDVFNGLLFNGTNFKVNTNGEWKWHRQAGDISRYKGHRAHIEILDNGNGWVAVDEIRFANRGQQPPELRPSELAKSLLAETKTTSAKMLSHQYATLFAETIQGWRKGTKSVSSQHAGKAVLINFGFLSGLFSPGNTESALETVSQKMRTVGEKLPAPLRVLAISDGSGEDERVFIRGNHKSLGPIVPRRMLEAISGSQQLRITKGSGRLELARRLLASSNPFPSRVFVNRVWHHLFGRGIVASVDNFGVLGQRPTHPELLDHLASTFVSDGWSMKRLIRRLMLSRTYRMSSKPTAKGTAADPQNLLLHRMRIRRLQGEVIRDTMLAVSHRLNHKMFGPSVPVYLTRFMQGRGRPRRSGPLDGNGRRSIYIAVKRNFLPPMMLAFDTPVPFNCIGRRNVSNVPAQALILMNDPFVIQQAERWAKQVLSEKTLSPANRITNLYRSAFSREPKPEETSKAVTFLKLQAKSRKLPPGRWKTDPKTWADLCHVLFNVKEFIFVR